MAPLYIISSSCISPQQSFTCEGLDMDIQVSENNMLPCIEPDFKAYINPVQIRRMSRALKIGFATAVECLNKSEDIIPEAIMIGTGKGCLTDTEQFLHSIREYNETALNATHFIHSTYNQLNGMIALNRKISSYNMTYVHRGFSFEHALLDAFLLFDEGDTATALVGSFDEMTAEHFTVKKHWGYWKRELINSLDLIESKTPGTISGEGSAFYLLNKEKPLTEAISITHVSTLFRPTSSDIEEATDKLLADHSLQRKNIDIILSGNNGDRNLSESYLFFEQLFPASQVLFFKHLCGEYDTATSFACWLSHRLLQTQQVPPYLFHPEAETKIYNKGFKYVLIYNNYTDLNQSLILLSRDN